MTDPRPLVLLVQLPIPPPGAQPVQGNVPLAAAYLKLFARRRGLESSLRIEILPPPLADTLGDQAMVEEILRRGPWLVGFTCYLWNIARVLWIAERLKAADPEIRILLGGPEITADNRWVLEQPAIDFAILGEGEQTFAELLAQMYPAHSVCRFPERHTECAGYIGIPGLWTRRGGTPARRVPLADLDAIASPYVEGILDVGPGETMFLETVRGCRYRCKYCYYPKSYDSICVASAEQVAASLRYANRHHVGEVFLLDPTLNQRPDFAEFLRLLARENPDRRFSYSAELRAEGIDGETARLLAAANFKEVEVGLQSIDPEAQRRMGRPVDLAAFERGTAAMLAAGIRVRLDMILGLPGDTPDSIRRGLDYLDRVRPFSELQVFNLSILPGTAFRAEAEALGLEYQPRPPYYVLRTPTLDVEAMYELMAEAQDRFGIEFDVPESLSRSDGAFRGEAIDRGCIVDLDSPSPAAVPPPGRRTQAFTLWLRAADFTQRQEAAADLIRRLLADNPHTTLRVVLEPAGDPALLTPDVLESLLAVCHETVSYLDWYYSLHPGRLLGAKQLVVILPEPGRWEDVEEYATVVAKSQIANLRSEI